MSPIAIDKLGSRHLKIFAGLLVSSVLSIAGVKAALPAEAQNQPQHADAAKPNPQPKKHHWYQFGRASWYGKAFQGQETASGESYNMYDMTCAHRSLPLGSLVRVTNLRNHKSVLVRVNDRGPMPENRVIDLSYAAANFLGFSGRGTAPVRVDLVKTTDEVAQLNWPAGTVVQAGAQH
jgi:rare lipoprotein A